MTKLQILCFAYHKWKCSRSKISCKPLADVIGTRVVINRYRFISEETITSLQIMLSESHPNYHNQGPTTGTTGSKESLSVYGLFHHLARTAQGKATLRQYFLRPSLDISIIEKRLNTISVLLRSENASALESISKNLTNVKNMRQVVIQLTKGIASNSNKGGIARGIWATIRQVRM